MSKKKTPSQDLMESKFLTEDMKTQPDSPKTPDPTWLDIPRKVIATEGPIKWGDFGSDGEPILRVCPQCRRANPSALDAVAGRCGSPGCGFDMNIYLKELK